jgi:hypothetical protein
MAMSNIHQEKSNPPQDVQPLAVIFVSGLTGTHFSKFVMA